MSTRKLGATLPEEAVDRFDTFCETTGLKKWRAVVAALELIRLAPPVVRDRLMAGDPAQAAEWLEALAAGLELAQDARRADGESPGRKSKRA